jgi:hypothetical protein
MAAGAVAGAAAGAVAAWPLHGSRMAVAWQPWTPWIFPSAANPVWQ